MWLWAYETERAERAREAADRTDEVAERLLNTVRETRALIAANFALDDKDDGRADAPDRP